MTDNLDDYDFTPTSSSNLASLFGSSPVHTENSSLTYTAPKQPKPGTSPDTKTETPKKESSVVCARVVQVWKLTDGKYQTLGKHGLAIIGSSVQNSYEMVLYKEKRNVIMRAKICPSLEIHLKKDDFASFYDDTKENWLIKFNNGDDCVTVMDVFEKYGCSVKQDTRKSVEGPVVSENGAKADILSRIAKMGQSILPNTDLENEKETIETSQNISTYHTSDFKRNQYNSACALSPSHVVQAPQLMNHPMSFDPLNLLYAENRTNNTEVRLNLSHISDKLNQIISLVDTKQCNSDYPNLKSKIKALELQNENLLRELIKSKEENKALRLSVRNEEPENCVTLTQTIEQQKLEIKELKDKLEVCKNHETLNEGISRLEGIVSSLQLILKAYEMSHEDIKKKNANFITFLKEAMNTMQGTINKDGIVESTTLKIIQHFQQVYETN